MSDRSDVSRRGFLAAIATGTVAAWLATHAHELEAAARLAAEPGDTWLFLTADQAATLDAVTAQICPTDETPGAREAKVVRFIDRSFATFLKEQSGDLEGALKELGEVTTATIPGATSFAALTSDQQIAVLKEHEKKKDSYFGFFRFLTIVGLFSFPSYGGNDKKVGFKMIGFEDRFAWTPPFGWYDRA